MNALWGVHPIHNDEWESAEAIIEHETQNFSEELEVDRPCRTWMLALLGDRNHHVPSDPAQSAPPRTLLPAKPAAANATVAPAPVKPAAVRHAQLALIQATDRVG